MMWIIIIAAILLGLFLFRKPQKDAADKMIEEVSKYTDYELTPHEKNLSNKLYQIVQVVYKDFTGKYTRDSSYQAAIDEIALEVFKCGMFRLKDKKLANKYFLNRGYIEVNKDKFKKDLTHQIHSESFMSQTSMDTYILKWVMKFKNDSKVIDNFLS